MKQNVKRFGQFLNESEDAVGNSVWDSIYSSLSKFNSPKIIRWTDGDGANITLNWMSGNADGIDVVLAVKNLDTRVSVVGSQADAIKSELKSAGFKETLGDPDYSGMDAAKVVAAIQSVIKNHKLQ